MSLNKMVKEKNELKDFNPVQVLHKQPKSFMCALKKSLVSHDHKAENANKMQTCILQGLSYTASWMPRLTRDPLLKWGALTGKKQDL